MLQSVNIQADSPPQSNKDPLRGDNKNERVTDEEAIVSDFEIDWMIRQRPLIFAPAQFRRDYGVQEAMLMCSAVRAVEMPKTTAGALAWPGVGTRWQRFVAWWRNWRERQKQQNYELMAREALAEFAKAIGRIRTFRALALDDADLQRILDRDEIFPSGLLQPGIDEFALRRVIDQHGVRKVAVCRLYISEMHRIGGADPSFSLHDDWQTTCIIASDYATRTKGVHLFELSVPAVESLGWNMMDVANTVEDILGKQDSDHCEDWFNFAAPAVPESSGGVWLDARLQRTERFGLYTVPFLRRRLRNLYVFGSVREIESSVAPFVEWMSQLHRSASGNAFHGGVDTSRYHITPSIPLPESDECERELLNQFSMSGAP